MKPAQGKASFLREVFLGSVVVAFGLAAWGCASSGSTTLAVTASSVLTGSMASARANHTATLLNNGKVLIAGGASSNGSALASAELYDPTIRNFTPTASMLTARYSHTATLLNNGKVLIAGGVSSNGSTLASAELYDPAAGTFTPTGSMATARALQTASRLNNGLVLFAGGSGSDGSALASAELYDPATGIFTSADSMATARTLHTATRLNNGLVLIAGGSGSSGSALASAELYDPGTEAFIPTGSMATARTFHTATLLNGGMVLLAGGFASSSGSALASAELYDPATGVFTPTGNMTAARGEHTATLLTNGTVLVAGGKASGVVLASEEQYDSASGTFAATASMKVARDPFTATLLITGAVLIAGGDSGSSTISIAELYQPGTVTLPGLVSIAVSPLVPPFGGALGGKEFIPVGGSESFTATGTFSDGAKRALASVIWSSSDTAVATISNGDGGGGVAVGVGAVDNPLSVNDFAKTSIIASLESVSGSTELHVGKAAGIDELFPPGNTTIVSGDTLQYYSRVNYLFNYINANNYSILQAFTSSATWTSSASLVAKISPTGLVTTSRKGSKTGSTTITAVIGSASATATLTVKALLSFAVTPANPSIPFALGETKQFTATGTYSDASIQNLTNLATWTSSAPGVAAIGPTGLATFVGQGSTTIQAAYRGITISTTLTVVPPAIAGFTLTGGLPLTTVTGIGDLSSDLAFHTATLLNDGKVLIAGGFGYYYTPGQFGIPSLAYFYSSGAELYEPATGTFTPTGGMTTARFSHTATLLNNGKVLIVGGTKAGAAFPSAELYDPATGTFTSTGSMATGRANHTATLLNNGKVLIAGGSNYIGSSAFASAELYDPATGAFTPAASMATSRFGHTATLLNNGNVLIAGGSGSNGSALTTAELYDPAAGTFTSTGSMASARFYQTATLLNNGNVLIAGGSGSNGSALTTAELYDPAAGTFTSTGSMASVRFYHTATLLNNGNVLVAGGEKIPELSGPDILASAELYDTAAGTFAPTGSMNSARYSHTATLLNNGMVLMVAGGDDSAELYLPAALAAPVLVSIAVTPTDPSIPLGNTEQFTATGTYSDSSAQNLTSSAAWTSSVTGVATISTTGLATSAGLGPTTIQAAVGTVNGTTTLTVTSAAAPPPVLTFLLPANAMAGGAAFSLTVNGSNFTAASTVNWNGSSRGTLFVSSTQLIAFITTTDIATAGIAQVTVNNPAPSGASAAFPFSVMGILMRVSVASDGTQANAGSGATLISGNGRYVLFFSAADNLVTGDANGYGDIFLADTCTGAPAGCTFSVTRVSVANDGSEGNSFTTYATMSADGRFVAFQSNATNLVPGITIQHQYQIYVRDTCTGGPAGCVPSTVLVSAAPDGTAGNGSQGIVGSAISGDGRYVAFAPGSSNLIPSNATILVRDTCFGALAGCAPSTIAASVATDGTPGVSNGELPSISADGRYVAFDYGGGVDTLGTGPSTAYFEVYLRDTCLGAPAGCTPSTRRASVANDGSPGNGVNSQSSSVSADGRYVAFISDASNLVTGDTNSVSDIFVRDTCIGAPVGCTPSTTRVSVASDGSQGNNSSGSDVVAAVQISANGRFVAFDSLASNLVPNEIAGNIYFFVRDTCAGAPLGCTPSTSFGSVPDSLDPSLSGDGQFLTFVSSASNLVSGDTNGVLDAFLATGFAPAASSVPTLTSLSPSNVLAGAAGFNVEIAGSGFVPGSVARWNGADRVTIFVSSAKLLVRVLASDMTPTGVANVTVFNPAPGGGTSTSLPFTLN